MLGRVILYDPEKGIGQIQPEGRTVPLLVYASGLPNIEEKIRKDDYVEFETENDQEGKVIATHVRLASTRIVQRDAGQNRGCFIVMPYGRTAEEIRWFAGWYRQVIEPAVRAAGLDPILAAAQERPNAINDEIRTHLAFDAMVVVDLGGMTPDAEPNPNVMYELGIRHAFNLPHVIMAWAGQRLPFDISNQRAIMERRDLIDIDVNKEKLAKFIGEALQGNHYRPMDAVARVATLEAAERGLGADSVLGVLVEEVRDLRSHLTSTRRTKTVSKVPSKASRSIAKRVGLTVAAAIGGKEKRKLLRDKFLDAGGTLHQWGKVLSDTIEAKDLSADKLEVVLRLSQKYPATPQSQPQKDGASTDQTATSNTQCLKVKQLLGNKPARRKVQLEFLALGGTLMQWKKVMSETIDMSLAERANKTDLVRDLAKKYGEDGRPLIQETDVVAAAFPSHQVPSRSFSEDQPSVQARTEEGEQ